MTHKTEPGRITALSQTVSDAYLEGDYQSVPAMKSLDDSKIAHRVRVGCRIDGIPVSDHDQIYLYDIRTKTTTLVSALIHKKGT